MAATNLQSKVAGRYIADVVIGDHTYQKVQLIVLENLCADVIIGHDILNLHSNVKFSFGGTRPPLICGLTTMKAPYPALFNNLSPNCKPIAIKSRRYSEADSKFIKSEVK